MACYSRAASCNSSSSSSSAASGSLTSVLHKLLLLRTKKVAQSWASRWERGVDDGNNPT